ncbi:hypothetical protein GGE07_003532 [Sinorhizobium terangae]|nr:hypothetical protein [Sinorhizobium terangae]
MGEARITPSGLQARGGPTQPCYVRWPLSLLQKNLYERGN